jgi:hypothetical protein
MQTLTVAVTPTQAQEWLDKKNTRNRTKSDKLSRLYAKDMINGDWQQTHQGIAFYEDGVLADGQTRLQAITIANITIMMPVTFGIPCSASDGIDIHRKRTTANQLSISGDGWIGKNEVAVIQQIHLLNGIKDAQSIYAVRRFAESIEEALLFSKDQTSNTVRHITTAPFKAAVVLAFKHENKERLAEFCAVCRSGIMVTSGDVAAIRLREKLISLGDLKGTASGRIEVSLLTMKAIQLFCKKTIVSKLVTPKEQIYKL